MITATRKSVPRQGVSRRARKAGAPGAMSVADVEFLLSRVEGDNCSGCGLPFGSTQFRQRWTCCFMVSLAEGGHARRNASILCRRCQIRRANAQGVRSVREYALRSRIHHV